MMEGHEFLMLQLASIWARGLQHRRCARDLQWWNLALKRPQSDVRSALLSAIHSMLTVT
jgi:hypothetical protein